MPKLSGFKITKKALEDLPRDKDAVYFDCELKGFGVRIKPKGRAAYVLQYRNVEGVSRRFTLGLVGAMTAEQARTHAKKLLGNIAAGHDPAETKKENASAETVAELCEAYLEAIERGLNDPKKAVIFGKSGEAKKASTVREDKSRINRHIVPLLGKRKVRDLTTTDITKFMRDVTTGKTAIDLKTKARGRARVTGGAGIASRTVGLLGGIMAFAVSEGIISHNPCRGVKRPKDGVRDVRLSSAQYRALGEALDKAFASGEPWQSVNAVKLLALTGCRLGEIEKLKWSEVDFEGHALRLEDSKTRKSVRPLGAAALAVLAGIEHTFKHAGDYVFPAVRLDGAPYGSLPKGWLRIVAHAATEQGNPLEGLTPHGLRHAYASVGGDLGLTEITIAALIGHSSATVTGRYIHALDSALIGAADRVAARIESHMTGQNEGGAVVVPLRRM